jgi:hypothetical protein
MTGNDNRIAAVNALLLQTEQAHGTYETAELNGVYDQDWPHWYAAYAVEHGMGALVGHPVTTDQVAQFLASTYAEFQKIEPKPSESWAAYLARRVTAEL